MSYNSENYYQIVTFYFDFIQKKELENRSTFNRYDSLEKAKSDLKEGKKANPDFKKAYIEEVKRVRTRITDDDLKKWTPEYDQDGFELED